MSQEDLHLDRAAKYAAKGNEYHWKAGQEIVAAQRANPALSTREIARRIDMSEAWVRDIVRHVTTAKPGSQVDWNRGSHGTKAEIEEGARKLLSRRAEAAKLIASLPPSGLQALASAMVDNPKAQWAIDAEQDRRLERNKHLPRVEVPEPKWPLLHRIEGDRVHLEQTATLMAGHWQDGRYFIGEEEEKLVRDSMAQAVMAVEKTITDALRSETVKETEVG